MVYVTVTTHYSHPMQLKFKILIINAVDQYDTLIQELQLGHVIDMLENLHYGLLNAVIELQA